MNLQARILALGERDGVPGPASRMRDARGAEVVLKLTPAT